MTIKEAEQAIVDDFNEVDDWMDRYSMIIDAGEELAPYPDALRTPDRIIDGCQSRVWIDAAQTPEGKIHFRADSDALIVKGIIALLMRVLNDRTPREVLDADLDFINRIGLAENLSPTRSNGLRAMVKQMKAYALAFAAKNGQA